MSYQRERYTTHKTGKEGFRVADLAHFFALRVLGGVSGEGGGKKAKEER